MKLIAPFYPVMRKKIPVWIVRRAPGKNRHFGLLNVSGRVFRCILGRSGISVRKREGDGATPAGRLMVLGGFRSRKGFGQIPGASELRHARPDQGWCDAPDHARYNRQVLLPFAASHETLARRDRLYDIVMVLDWNYSRRARNRGSAIFLHLTRPDKGPTQGCVALDPQDMRLLLPQLVKGIALQVRP